MFSCASVFCSHSSISYFHQLFLDNTVADFFRLGKASSNHFLVITQFRLKQINFTFSITHFYMQDEFKQLAHEGNTFIPVLVPACVTRTSVQILDTNWLLNVKCLIPAAPPFLESKLDCQNKLRRLMEMGFSEVSQATELLCLPSLPCPLATLVVPLAVLNIL